LNRSPAEETFCDRGGASLEITFELLQERSRGRLRSTFSDHPITAITRFSGGFSGLPCVVLGFSS
jgi:hypothetical protein